MHNDISIGGNKIIVSQVGGVELTESLVEIRKAVDDTAADVVSTNANAATATTQAGLAQSSSTSAQQSASSAISSSTAASSAAAAALVSENAAQQSSVESANSASQSEASNVSSANSAMASLASSSSAANSATAASTSETNASASEIAAMSSATNAAISEVNASGSATSAGTSATNAETFSVASGQSAAAAETSKTVAETAAIESEAARDEIVDLSTTTTTADKIPLADSNGHLDVNWTPLLAAMYPYSGVIGSVDKWDLFGFFLNAYNSSWSNLIDLRPNTKFNINGRLIAFDHPHTFITLPEAESTAARAIAFDDIFLDWNGNVVTHRSITPHRTTTGFDRDLIAAEHGYTKVSTGLYRTGDTYALLLGRATRRNKGAYHPVYNKEGTRPVWFSNSQGADYWAHLNVKKLNSASDCFDFGTADNHFVPAYYGDIGRGDTWQIGNPQKQYYDAIYADDFTPLYYSAKNVIDRQALLFDNFNRAVAGETFSGAEGTHNYGQLINQSNYTASLISTSDTIAVNSNSIVFTGATPTGAFAQTSNTLIPQGTTIAISYRVDAITEGAVRILGFYFDGGFRTLTGDTSTVGDVTTNVIVNIPIERIVIACNGDSTTATVTNISIEATTVLSSARPQFLMVDIIGSLDAMPADWFPDPDNYEATKDRHIPGNWLAVGEEGESLIPDGTSKSFKLSRKCLECYQVLRTTDNGVTWTNVTGNIQSECESSANAFIGSPPNNWVYIVSYHTSVNPFELAGNDGHLTRGDVFTTADNRKESGVLLASNLFNKIPTNYRSGRTSLINIGGNPLDGSYNSRLPSHSTPLLLQEVSDTPVVKVLPLISELGYLQIIYKEMKHNGTSWGDDNKFNIIDNQSTVTDLNGESVIVGQKRVELPYHFNGETY